DHRLGHAVDRRGDPARDLAVLPRLRRAAAGHLPRCPHQHLPGVLHLPPLVVLVARHLHPRHRAQRELHRRRPAGRLRPAAEQEQGLMSISEQSREPVLTFSDLDVRFRTEFGSVHAVKGISLDVKPGEVVALVGESGSGKSVTSMTALGLLPKNARTGGRVTVGESSVRDLDDRGLRRMRGNDVAMVFQEPMTALNPVLTIGTQLTEALELHGIAYGHAADERAAELLRMV